MFSSKPMKVLPVLAGAAFAVGLIGQASALPVDSSLRKAAAEASPQVQDVRYVAKKKHVAKRHVVKRKKGVRYARRGYYGPGAAFGAVAAGIGAAIAADRYNDRYYYGPGYYSGYNPGYYDYGYNYGYYPGPAYYGPRYRYRHGGYYNRPAYPRPPVYSGAPLGGATTMQVVPHYRGPVGGGGGVVRPFGNGGIVGGFGGGGGAVSAPAVSAPLGGATTMQVR